MAGTLVGPLLQETALRGKPKGIAFFPVEGVKRVDSKTLVILLHIFSLITGYPTTEDTSVQHASFNTLVNVSTGSNGPVESIQYIDAGILTTVIEEKDRANESPTIHSPELSGKDTIPGHSKGLPYVASSTWSSPPFSPDSFSPAGLDNAESNALHKESDPPPVELQHPGLSSREAEVIKGLNPGKEPLDRGSWEEAVPIEQKLMNYLMKQYERSVRPVKNASDTVMVRMGLTLTQIFDMDEKNQILVTNVWLDQEWGDMFLTWNPDEYDGLRILRLPCHKLWLPDIVLYNNAAEYTDGLMPANAMITYEGNVFWPVPTKLQSSCKVDVTYFPFDEQYCRLKFGSWTYDGYQVDMVNRTTEVDLSNYVQNGEWYLVEISVQRNVVYYACCPEPFPDVTFIIHIRRRTLYYMYNVIFPCIMMSALTLLVFCLPPDSGEKITMGITVLLAFSVFMLTIAEDLPETSEFIPLLSIYLTIVMALTSVSVILTVFVLNLHHRGPDNTPVPSWLRRIFLRNRVTQGLIFTKSNPDTQRLVDAYLTDNQTSLVRNVSLKLTIESLAQELKEELSNCANEVPVNEPIEDPSIAAQSCDGQYLLHPEYRRRPQSIFSSQNTKTNDEILNALKKIIERYESDDCEEEITFEWRQIALAVDRILFWVFLFGTLASTSVVLVVAPVTKWL